MSTVHTQIGLKTLVLYIFQPVSRLRHGKKYFWTVEKTFYTCKSWQKPIKTKKTPMFNSGKKKLGNKVLATAAKNNQNKQKRS